MAETALPLNQLKAIQAFLQKKGQTLAAAESCTGGLLSFWLTHLPGASRHFKGGVIPYTEEVKERALGLDSALMEQKGVVNEECAAFMARGVRKALKADWGLSITGVAGPSLGFKGEPVGLVAFGLSSEIVENSCLKQFHQDSREEIRCQSALFALDFLISGLK